MAINEMIIKEISNCSQTTYLIDFATQNEKIFLTTYDEDLFYDDKQYVGSLIKSDIQFANLSENGGFLVKMIDDYKGRKIDTEAISNAVATIKIAIIQNKKITTITTIFKGYINEITLDNDVLEIALLPNVSKLQRSLGALFSPICRECLGSNKCGINLENYKTQGEIAEIVSQDCFIGTHQENKKTPTGYYKYGIIKFTSGKLCGLSVQIKDEQDGKIFLLKNTKMLSVGDTYEIFVGCDKSMKTCREKFNNIVNFRGEPFVNDVQ